MKKYLALFLSICIFFSNITCALTRSIELKEVKSIEVGTYDGNSEEYTSITKSGGLITQTFKDGNTARTMNLPTIINANENNEVVKYLSDETAQNIINKQVAGLENSETIADELRVIANKVRDQYTKIEIENDSGEKEIYYVLTSGELEESKEYALKVGANDVELLYKNETKEKETDSISESAEADATETSGQGESSQEVESGSTELNGEKKSGEEKTNQGLGELKDPIDIHGYQFWELLNLDVRSAEYEVIEKCWGEDCGEIPENIVPKNEVVHSEKIKVGSFEHTFYMHQYYAQDVTKSAYCGDRSEMSEILSVLTKPNRDEFENYVERWLENNVLYYEYKGSIKVINEERTKQERDLMKSLIMEQVDILARNYYARIGVITKEHKEKSFFVFEPWVYNLNKTVFAEKSTTNGSGGELIGVRTDEYNDVFTWNDLGGGMTDILNSQDPKSRVSDKKHYRLKDSNFYLCQNCSMCDSCEKLVAYGEEAPNQGTGNGWYVSKYCANHACRFVWKWLVDSTNNGPKEEGLRCREDKLAYYCENHRCGNGSCVNAIVGKSLVADTGGVADARDTGATTEDRYSGYCATHKCRYVDCQEQRISLDTTPWGISNGEITVMHTPRNCPEHETSCVLCGSNDNVSKDSYNATGAMICDSCAGIVRDAEFEVLTVGDAVLGAQLIGPNAPTLIFLGGTAVKRDIDGTMAVVDGVENLKGYNIICITGPNMTMEAHQENWEPVIQSTIPYLQDLVRSGKIDPSTICVDGFSDGGYGAFYLVNQLQGTSVTDASGSTSEFDMKMRLLDSPNSPNYRLLYKADISKKLKATWPAVKNLMDRGAEVGIYSFTLGEINQDAYIANIQNQDERVTGAIYQLKHEEANVRKLYEEDSLNLK